MASGKKVYPGAAACPEFLEFGTKVEIEGKIYTCEDRMHKRYRDKWYFDIWMPEKAYAYEFGRQLLEVKIITQHEHQQSDDLRTSD